MKLHPFRGNLAGRDEFRGRIKTAILKSANGQRVLKECLEALDKPVNSDEESRRFVIRRYACELEIEPDELKDLLKRFAAGDLPGKDEDVVSSDRPK